MRDTNSRRLAGDHCTSSNNDLRLGWLDSSSDCLRANATVKRPSLTSPHEGREPAIKAKESEVRSAGGADGLVGGGNRFCKGKPHLWRPPPLHRRQQLPARQCHTSERRPPQCAPVGPHSRPRRGCPRTRVPPSRRTMCCATPPVQPTAQGVPGRGWPTHGATDTRAADGQPCSAPAVGGGTGSSTRAAQAGEPDTRQLTVPRTANALLPQSLREGAGRCPCGGGTQLDAPSSPAQMMNILEAEGRGKATARLALPHHEACGHHPG
jgi:hypothetical protein